MRKPKQEEEDPQILAPDFGLDAVDFPVDIPPMRSAPLPAPAGYEYDKNAERYNAEADTLTEQAAVPMAKPRGIKEHLVEAARAFIEGMARPQDPYAEQRRREDLYSQSSRELVARAEQARNRGFQQQQLGQGARREANDQSNADRNYQLAQQQANAPVVTNMGEGTIGLTDRGARTTTFQHDPNYTPKSATKPANLQMKAVDLRDGRKGVPVNYDTDGTQGPAGHSYDMSGKDVSVDVIHIYDPNVVPGFNSNTGSPQFAPRADIRLGGGGGIIPQPSQGALDAADDAKRAVANINNLGGLFNKDFVGPGAGRFLDLKSMLPEQLASLPPGYADFASANAALKSDVIKAITGAQMNANEEKRILASVPIGTDRADVWLAKYQQLVQRVNVVNALKEQRIGAGSYTLEDLDAIAAGRLRPGQAPQGNRTPANVQQTPQQPAAPSGGREIHYDANGRRK